MHFTMLSPSRIVITIPYLNEGYEDRLSRQGQVLVRVYTAHERGHAKRVDPLGWYRGRVKNQWVAFMGAAVFQL